MLGFSLIYPGLFVAGRAFKRLVRGWPMPSRLSDRATWFSRVYCDDLLFWRALLSKICLNMDSNVKTKRHETIFKLDLSYKFNILQFKLKLVGSSVLAEGSKKSVLVEPETQQGGKLQV